MIEETVIPEKFKSFLGEYKAVLFDSHCGEPIMWGYPIIAHLGEDLWKEISNYGGLEYGRSNDSGQWYLVTKYLTHKDAVEKYGSVTNLELGPRGGFRTITFGQKTFCQKRLREQE